MKLFRPKYPSILKFLYPQRVSKINDKHSIYLTFDDGPIPEVTPWVLDQLVKYNAKATFFCIGDNVKKHPDIFRRISNEEHFIGNHTYNHLNGWKISNSEYIENTWQAEEIMIESGNQAKNNKPRTKNSELRTPTYKLFRPPYGKIKNSQAKQLNKQGFKIVMWDVISGDYDQDFSAEKCFNNVIKNGTAGSIIVLHDSKKAFRNLKETLPRILAYYSEKGLEFRSLKDVL
ncbi:polysaccharide deacetylase family protein [Christiangramia forsetii]|uniref:Protein containing polysaccharide deacetylase domain n=2 Tax=Christiangramia forsetii TaxID=411153 RepID=A0LXN8_CHRFK|nr:polysaccharide deacetylase family protein [Christiangramia forsetii]GGG36346.1 polysaccharide deacetylase [Christiangramia forsetii]CAL65133.1 protein containing polysaccharide deacetylase domain [Christiangramia forsetii KT0803]